MTFQGLSFDDIPEIAWTATRDGRMLQFNREWVEYAGLRVRSNAAAATLEKAWWAAVHRDDRDFVRQALLGEMQAAGPFELELRLRRADGMDRWFRLFVSPLDGGRD